MFFEYGEAEVNHLSARDPALGIWIERIGRIERQIVEDPFLGLMDAITGQRISGRAAETIWARLMARGLNTPQAVLEIPAEELASLGLGGKKAQWMRAAALRLEELHGIGDLSDAEAIRRLSTFDGVGRWTAEMLLLFTFRRMDIFSKGDFGIRKGLSIVHGAGASDDFERFRALYSPCGSVASLYFWEIAAIGENDAEV